MHRFLHPRSEDPVETRPQMDRLRIGKDLVPPEVALPVLVRVILERLHPQNLCPGLVRQSFQSLRQQSPLARLIRRLFTCYLNSLQDCRIVVRRSAGGEFRIGDDDDVKLWLRGDPGQHVYHGEGVQPVEVAVGYDIRAVFHLPRVVRGDGDVGLVAVSLGVRKRIIIWRRRARRVIMSVL